MLRATVVIFALVNKSSFRMTLSAHPLIITGLFSYSVKSIELMMLNINRFKGIQIPYHNLSRVRIQIRREQK